MKSTLASSKNAALMASATNKESIKFESLSLVEKPDSSLNSSSLSETLEGCEGYLQSLPLRTPNADARVPSTIADMVNILTSTGIDSRFEKEKEKERADEEERKEGEPDKVFDYENSALMKKELSKVKSRSGHTKAPGVLGHVVKPGCISFYSINGKTLAVSEGRWWLIKSPIKSQWLPSSRNISLDANLVTAGEARIVRVLPGSVGLVRIQGTEVLLDVGVHIFNSGTVNIIGTLNYSGQKYFSHGRFHYLRVERGSFAKVWTVVLLDGVKTVVPRLIGQGVHFIDNHMFKFEGFVSLREKVIDHGSIHRISVVKGSLAKVIQDSKPRILGEGTHVIESTDFNFVGFEDVTKTHCIQHGTITILRVTRGKVALAWKDNEPLFITAPGLYEFDSPDFSFDSFRDAEERLIQLGAKKIVQVQTGQVGVTYDDGILKILHNGTHEICRSNHIIHCFLSTQEKSIRLSTLTAQQKNTKKSKTKKHRSSKQGLDTDWNLDIDQDSDLTICETKDLVKVGIRADVFFAIANPEKCIQKIDSDDIEDLVRETAIATVTNIVRSTALNQIAQSKNVNANPFSGPIGEPLQVRDEIVSPPANAGELPPPSAPMAEFFEKTHDEFMSKLHDDFLVRYGIDIANIRIEAFKIMDQDLSESISKHALTTAQIENEMANLEGMSLISTQKERTAAEVKNISALADAEALKTTADAENQRRIDRAMAEEKTAAEVKNISALADAEALKTAGDAENQRRIDRAMAESEALRISTKAAAEAKAEAVLLKAKSEAESIRLKAAAEAERVDMVAKTDLGKQEALLTIYADMVVQSNKGVEKVVYLDPSVNKDSPFALSSMQNLNDDLHALTKLGIVASNTGPSQQ